MEPSPVCDTQLLHSSMIRWRILCAVTTIIMHSIFYKCVGHICHNVTYSLYRMLKYVYMNILIGVCFILPL